MLRRILHSVFLGAAILTVATCSELFDSFGPPVAKVIVTAPGSGVILVGETLQLSATTLDASDNVLTGHAVRWESDNPQIGTVSPTGLVTGVSPGHFTFIATSGKAAYGGGIDVGIIPPSTAVTAANGSVPNQIIVWWPAAPGATSYNVYWGITPDITPQNGTKASTDRTFWYHNGLTANTTYYYVVTAVSSFGEGPPSAMVSATASAIASYFSCVGTNGNYIAANSLKVAVGVVSNFQVVHVTASVGGRSTDLVFNPVAYCTKNYITFRAWEGTIPVDGLPRGPLTVTATATDAFGNVVQASSVFQHDLPPTLTIATPDFSVARPTLRLAASCQDDDPKGCTSVSVKVSGGPTLATGQTGVDQTVSLAAYDGQDLTLVFTASDSVGQVTGMGRHVFVELSTQLSEVASVDGLILDVQPDRILFLNQSNGGNALTIRDRASGSDVVIYNQPGHIPEYGYLTPVGAMFVENLSNTRGVHEWHLGALSDFGATLAGPPPLVVKDRYALFAIYPGGLIRRDVIAGTNTSVTPSWTQGDLAANGDVVYAGSNQIFRDRNGVSTQLTSDGTGISNESPRTDGVNVVYAKSDGAGRIITLYDTGGEHLLASGAWSTERREYRTTNGWVAYPKGGQLWTRSPTGQEAQATAFSHPGEIEALGPNGEIVVVNTVITQGLSSFSRRYVTVPNYGTPREIGSRLGSPFFQNGNLFITIGRSLFQVNP